MLHVGPVLQSVGEGSAAVMFETAGTAARVEFGAAPALGRAVAAERRVRGIFHATMTGLAADSRYFYRVVTEQGAGALHSFRTAPARGTRKPFRFAVYSDCQQRPEVHRRIVDTSLVAPAAAAGTALCDAWALALVVGDVVQRGKIYDEYRERLFAPAEALFSEVPLYAAIGNHEEDAAFYFDYFNLPRNGTPGYEQHWYSFDHGNAHFIGLDTNEAYRLPVQLDWLDRDLLAAGTDPRTDVIFAFFHHPWKSELWVEGEEEYSGEIVRRLEAALVRHGKVGAYFFGHTHGYARGQSKDAPLYWVNVATAGGTIDHWGEYVQRPYPEFQMSFDDYGIVLVTVDGAGFSGTRLSFGSEAAPKEAEPMDTFALRRSDDAPEKPRLAVAAGVLTASPYAGAVPHLETEWELPGETRWLRREKLYWNKDLNAGLSLTTLPRPPQKGPARVRYRSERLVWSPWSEPEILG